MPSLQDDIALVTNTVGEAEELTSEVESVSVCVGLTMNESKTKYMVKNIQGPEMIVNISGNSIELVKKTLHIWKGGLKMRRWM